MMLGRALVLVLGVGLCACGGSGGGAGGGPAPVNLVNFQVAGAILGQTTVSGTSANDGSGTLSPNQANDGSGPLSPYQIVGNRLFVTDRDNQRVLNFTGS